MVNPSDAVVLQVCPDHVSADALAAYLQSESIPAFVHDIAAIPGLEQGTEVLVPGNLLQRARELAARQPPPPSEEELTRLATGGAPRRGHSGGGRTQS
jgi:hypothetical protein